MIEDIGKYFVEGLKALGEEGLDGAHKIIEAVQAVEDEDDVTNINEGLVQFDEILDQLGQEEA